MRAVTLLSLILAIFATPVTPANAACTIVCSRTINGDYDVVPTGSLTGTPSDPCDVESGKIETAIFSSSECPTNYVDCVEGSLTFDNNGSFFSSGGGTSFMDELVCVKGHLTVDSTNVTNLHWPELLSIGGDVEIEDNSGLSTLYFPKLEIQGDSTGLSNDDDHFRVYNNGNLQLFQITALEDIQGDLIIEFNEKMEYYNPAVVSPVLTDIDGDLSIRRNALSDTEFLEELVTIGGDMKIWENRSGFVSVAQLTDINLPKLTSVDSIEIRNNWELEAITIPLLVDTGRIYLFDNGKNSTQDVILDFDVLESAGSLEIDGMDEMPDITDDFFPVLDTVDGKFQIEDCLDLTYVEFPALDTVGGEFIVKDNDVMTWIDVDSFNALSSVGDKFTISKNDALEFIVFANLETTGTAFATNDNFDIDDNDDLTTISFSKLATVYGRVWITNNALLDTVGLAFLEDAFRLRIKDNPSLGAAIALREYWDSLDACNCGTGTLGLSSSGDCEYSGNLAAGNDVMSYVCACEDGGPPGYPSCP